VDRVASLKVVFPKYGLQVPQFVRQLTGVHSGQTLEPVLDISIQKHRVLLKSGDSRREFHRGGHARLRVEKIFKESARDAIVTECQEELIQLMVADSTSGKEVTVTDLGNVMAKFFGNDLTGKPLQPRPRWTPENRPVVDGSKPASGERPQARVVLLRSLVREQAPCATE
jgi:hypothetical protein